MLRRWLFTSTGGGVVGGVVEEGGGRRNQIINVLSVQAYESFSSGGVSSNARQLRGGLQRARLLRAALLHLQLLVTLHSSLGFFFSSPLFRRLFNPVPPPFTCFFFFSPIRNLFCSFFFLLFKMSSCGRAAARELRWCCCGPRRCFPLSLPAQPLVLRSGCICFCSLAAEPLPERLKAG